MSNKSITYYVNRINEIYNGEPWFGETILYKINDVTEDQAFLRPEADVHSVAEIIAHMIYWRTLLIKRLEGDNGYTASMESKDNWPMVKLLQKEGWASLLQRLDSTQQKIAKLLAEKTDNLLDEEYKKGDSYENLIQGIIDHDIYHVGQIGLVKKMLR